MNPARALWSYLTRRRRERELADEIELHIEEKADELVAAGMSRADAVRAARRSFGNTTLIREVSEEVWRVRWAQDLAGDLRYAVRQLRHSPAFTVAAVLTLAVGIGANGAIFSIVNAVALQPLPYAHPAALVSVESMDKRGTPHPTSLSYFTFFQFRDAGIFERIVAYRDTGMTLRGNSMAVQLEGQIVSWDLFELLGVQPVLGRGFLPSEESRDSRVAVISHSAWQAHLGGDPGIIGRAIMLNDQAFTVVGVAPPDFDFPVQNHRVQIWTTIALDASSPSRQPMTEQRGARVLNAIARLPPGLTPVQARARLDAVAARLAKEHPATNQSVAATYVKPELERLLGDARLPLLLLWGAVGLVLLIACANLANMLLARTADRRHELGVRIAIGGSRGRIMRQLLTENLTLAVTGALLGLAGATAFVRGVVPMVVEHVPRGTDIRIDGGVMAFATAMTLAAAILVSLPAVVWLRRAAFGQGIRSDARGATDTHDRLRGALVVAQVSIGLMLLSGAGVLAASFVRLTQRDLGFTPENLLTFRVELPGARYSTEHQIAFLDSLLERLRALPGVSSASLGLPLPLAGNEMALSFEIEHQPTGPSARPMSNMALVGPGFFRTIGTDVLDGRDFTEEDDRRQARVLIVNQAFADRFFPGERAVGKRITSGATSSFDADGVKIFREIVGVVGNARQSTITRAPEPIYYFPYKQLPWGPPSVVLRATTPVPAIVPSVRQIVAGLDPQLPVYGVTTLSETLATNLAAPRLLVMLMGGFAATGLLLTATGLYGVLAYAVSRRTREIGVRVALGATRHAIVSMVLQRAMTLIATGTALGVVGALAAGILLRRLLVALDVSYAGVLLVAAIVTIVVTAVAASYPPAARAAAIDPTTALRAE